MSLVYRPEIAARIGWGPGEHELAELMHPRLFKSSISGYGPPRLQRPLYGVRLDAKGQMYILAATGTPISPEHPGLCLVTVGASNAIRTRRIPAGATDSRSAQVLDFAPDEAGGVYLLEMVQAESGESLNRLRRVDPQGRQLWARTGSVDHHELDLTALRGELGYLRGAADSVYVAPQSPQYGLARVDRDSGDIGLAADVGADVGNLILGANGALYFSQFREVAGQQRRVVLHRGLSQEHEQVVLTEIQLLDDLAGVDDLDRIYVRLSDGFARMAADGRVEWHQRVSGAVDAFAEQAVYVCTRSESTGPGGLEVQAWDVVGTAGEPRATLTLEVPADAWPTAGDVLTLVGVDRGRFYLYGGETSLGPGLLLIYDADGRLQERASFDGEGFDALNARLLPIESRLGPPSTQQIDRHGNVYVPLADPTGFKILRWTALETDP
jgi:hypothetical protein